MNVYRIDRLNKNVDLIIYYQLIRFVFINVNYQVFQILK